MLQWFPGLEKVHHRSFAGTFDYTLFWHDHESANSQRSKHTGRFLLCSALNLPDSLVSSQLPNTPPVGGPTMCMHVGLCVTCVPCRTCSHLKQSHHEPGTHHLPQYVFWCMRKKSVSTVYQTRVSLKIHTVCNLIRAFSWQSKRHECHRKRLIWVVTLFKNVWCTFPDKRWEHFSRAEQQVGDHQRLHWHLLMM